MPAIDRGLTGILFVAVAGIAAMSFVEPIPQDPAYHAFADGRTLAGIQNAWNVLTNLPFVVAGIWGFARMGRLAAPELRTQYLVLCGGIALVAFGSAYYHYRPSTAALVWDRLPMTIAFMALFSAVIGDRFSWIVGRALLWPLVALGIGSIAWWVRTENAGAGDLRPYALVQFLPMLLLPLSLWLRPQRWLRAEWLWAGLGAYAAAKLAEYFDSAIFAAGSLVSGHSLKHLLAALASVWVIAAFHSVPRVSSGAGS